MRPQWNVLATSALVPMGGRRDGSNRTGRIIARGGWGQRWAALAVHRQLDALVTVRPKTEDRVVHKGQLAQYVGHRHTRNNELVHCAPHTVAVSAFFLKGHYSIAGKIEQDTLALPRSAPKDTPRRDRDRSRNRNRLVIFDYDYDYDHDHDYDLSPIPSGRDK